MDALQCLVTAPMRGRHLHLPASTLHHAAAGALLCAHMRIRSHAGHNWSHAGDEQQRDRSELAKPLHDRLSIPNVTSTRRNRLTSRRAGTAVLNPLSLVAKIVPLGRRRGLDSLNLRRRSFCGSCSSLEQMQKFVPAEQGRNADRLRDPATTTSKISPRNARGRVWLDDELPP